MTEPRNAGNPTLLLGGSESRKGPGPRREAGATPPPRWRCCAWGDLVFSVSRNVPRLALRPPVRRVNMGRQPADVKEFFGAGLEISPAALCHAATKSATRKPRASATHSRVSSEGRCFPASNRWRFGRCMPARLANVVQHKIPGHVVPVARSLFDHEGITFVLDPGPHHAGPVVRFDDPSSKLVRLPVPEGHEECILCRLVPNLADRSGR